MLSKKLAILTSIYTVLCFIGIVIFSFVIDIPSTLLDIDKFSYKFLSGLGLFLDVLPSIIASVFFVVVATYIDTNSGKNLRSFSSSQMGNFRQIVIVICVNVVILFCANEVFRPIINAAKVEKENRYIDYHWYVDQSQESFELNDISSALFFIDSAIAMYPESQDALDLKEIYERAPAEAPIEVLQYFPEYNDIISASDPLETATTVLSMLHKAQEAYATQNYFDAHYYAFVGLELGGVNNPNSQALQMVSLDAWNKIQTWSGFSTNDDMEIYEKKRQGYASLIEGDSLSAYYTYLDLNAIIPHDPDVSRYFELSKNALLNEYFFIDETLDLSHFEKAKNVSFSVTRSDGLHYSISIGGVTNVRSAGNILKYLRNYSCTLEDADGKTLFSLSVPYVKLIGQPLSSFNTDVVNTLDLEEDSLVPRLLLTSVDRNTKGIVSAPYFSIGNASAIDDSLTLLPMSLDDFDLILEASAGARYINLASLFSFLPKAADFGFSELVYASFFLQRISYSFLVFAVFIFLAIQAWNFRLNENSIFRFYWVLIVPIFTVVAEGIRVLLSYGMSLISLNLARVEGAWQIPVMVCVFLVIIIVFSIRFLSLHVDNKNAK